MKRHHILPAKLNTIIPETGMGVQIYMSRRDIGSGTRPYIIIGVSSQYVTLYYTPRLLALRIKRNEWALLPAIEYDVDAKYLRQRIVRNIDLYKRLKMRFNRSHADRAMEVLGHV